MAYHRYHGVDTRIVRIFNTFGPRMRINDGRAVPTFIAQALDHEEITVFGDGSQTRSFTYITDEIDGFIKLIESEINEPVNIGNPVELSVLDLAEAIIRLTDSKSKIVFKDLPVDDPKVRQPDITRAKKDLGWEPKVDWEEGLKKTIAYFRETLGK